MDLNKNQRLAVEADLIPVSVVSGAGTGKTTVIKNRFEYLVNHFNLARDRILVVAFNKKARKELQDRILKSDGFHFFATEWIHTYHSFSKKILEEDIDKLGYKKDFNILDEYDVLKFIENLKNKLREEDQNFYCEYRPRAIYSIISGIKSKYGCTHLSAKDMLAKDKSVEQPIKIILKEYLKWQNQNNYLDFDDLIIFVKELFISHKDVLGKWQDYFQYIMIDEFQDIEPLQYEIFKLLALKKQNIFIVGDPDQCIYEWRRADIEIMLNWFPRDFPTYKKIILDVNYRSEQFILDVANNLITYNYKNQADAKKLIAHQVSKESKKVKLYSFFDFNGEANKIAWFIKVIKKNEGRRFADFAILCRMRAQFHYFEKALHQNGIPYRIYGGISFFDRLEIKVFLKIYEACFKNNSLGLEYVFDNLIHGLGPKTIEKVKNKLHSVEGSENLCQLINSDNQKFISAIKTNASIINQMSFVSQKISMFKKEIMGIDGQEFEKFLNLNYKLMQDIKIKEYFLKGQNSSVEIEERENNVNAFLNSFSNQDNKFSFKEFTKFIEISKDIHDAKNENSDCLTISTVHAVKGMEFNIVFVPGMNSSVYKDNLDHPKELEEARRVAYVAFTRAKDNLIISYPVVNLFAHNVIINKSRFIIEIEK